MLKKKVSNRNIEKIIQTDMLIPEFIQRYGFRIMIKKEDGQKRKKERQTVRDKKGRKKHRLQSYHSVIRGKMPMIELIRFR